MRIAFYAPLKAPDHPVPSGDRLLAQMFVAALARAGHRVDLASRLRTYEGRGDASRQARLAAVGAACARRLLRRWQRAPHDAPELWFTYHLYHKAPDPLGPHVSRALRIPYVVAEASFAPKQRDGPWRLGHASVEAALRAARGIVCVNPADRPMVDAVRDEHTPVLQLAPFLDLDALRGAAGSTDERAVAQRVAPPAGSPRLLAVAMLRPGDKLASYHLLAAALAKLRERPWHLVVVGDGTARAEVHECFARFEPGRVIFVGAQPREVVAALGATADLFVWPAVAEVLGLAMLEAQAVGLPVVAGRRPGSASMIVDGATGLLPAAGDADAFAAAVAALLDDSARRKAMGEQARVNTERDHGLPVAAHRLDGFLRGLTARRGAP